MSQYLVLNTKDFKWTNTHSFIHNKVTFIDSSLLSEILEISKEVIYQFRCKHYLNQYERINLGTLKAESLPLAIYYQLNKFNIIIDGKYYYPLEYVKMCVKFKKDLEDALYVISRILEDIKTNEVSTFSEVSAYLKTEFSLDLDIAERRVYDIINSIRGIQFEKCVSIYNMLLTQGVIGTYAEIELDFSYWSIDIKPYFKDIINDFNYYTIIPQDIDSVIVKSNNLDINGTIYNSPAKCSLALGTTKSAFIQRVNKPTIGHYDNLFINTMINSRIYYEGKSYYPAKLVEQYAEELVLLKDYLNKVVNIVNSLVENKIRTNYLADIAGVSTMVIRNIVLKKNTKINNIISLTKALRDNADKLNIEVPEAPTDLRFFNLG